MVEHPVSGPVMLDLLGTSLTLEEQEYLQHPAVGGIILFSRNYENPGQLDALVQSIRNLAANPVLIAVDHEGGRVQRFRQGFSILPPAANYAKAGEEAPALAERAGWLMAAELLALGIDFSFAPVLDIESGVSRVIGDRAFGEDMQTVADLAGAFRRGMHKAGMAAVGKHFPGHGGVEADSHLSLPRDTRNLDQLRERDLLPFQALIDQGLEAIMPAHVLYEHIDSQPAGYSSFWLQRILRSELGFAGAIFSDDLSMEGAAGAGNYAERAQLALDAGCDMVLVCNNPAAAAAILDSLVSLQHSRQSMIRLSAMRGKFSLSWKELLASPAWHEAHTQLQHLLG